MPFDLSSLSAGLPPEMVWGLVPRILGLLYVVAFVSLSGQVLGLVGSRGIAPVAHMLAAARQHDPGPRRFFDLPTLLWLSPSDGFLRALPLIGAAAGMLAMVGGPASWWALAVCWACYLSLDVCALMFPWDCLLLEAGFLALFLPAARTLPELETTALPLPAVAFMWRLLIIRLMWGFAKLKFIGTQKGDDLYLRGFLAWMPMCSPIGWAMQHAPNWFLRVSYVFMWAVEVVCPGLGFFTGLPRLISGVGLMALMGGIWATGNWGFFNLGYGALCIVLFDTQSSLFDASLASIFASPSSIAIHTALSVLALGALFYFPLNSWASQTWIHWPFDDLTYKRPWLEKLIGFYRLLAPFRLVNAYGVFPPNSSPPIKVVPVLEGSRDGVHWQGYEYKFMPTTERSKPPVVAPHHPRIDHSAIYAGSGMTDGDYMAGLVGAGKPYSYSPFSHWSWIHRLGQRVLEGEPTVLKLLGHNPFPSEPPKYVRVALRALTPTSFAERQQTGRFWHVRHAGLAFPAAEKNPLVWQYWLSPPELFHPDFVARRRRSAALSAMLAAYQNGRPHEEAVRVESELSADEVRVFWEELVPMMASTRGTWSEVDATAHAMRERFGEEQCLRFERIAERYAYLLRVRLEPHIWGDAAPKIEKRSNFRFHLLTQEVVLDGKAAYEAMLRDPSQAAARATQQSDASALHMIGVFRNEIVRYHAQTLRIARPMTSAVERAIPGILEFRDLLTSYVPPDERWLPECKRAEGGEWTVAGFDVETRGPGPLGPLDAPA